MAFNFVSFSIGIGSTGLDIAAAFFGGDALAVPLSVHTQSSGSEHGIIPGEGIGDDSIACTTANEVCVFVGDNDYLVVPILVDVALLVDNQFNSR